MSYSYSSEDGTMSEDGNWNSAQDFAKFKIMLPLKKCETYKDIARFGYESFFEELLYYNVTSDESRLKAIERYVSELIKLAGNTTFALKKKGTKDKMEKEKKILKSIRDDILGKLYSFQRDEIKKTREIKIKSEGAFMIVLDQVSNIESRMDDLLNQNNLIFLDKAEFDPRKEKKAIMERMMKRS